MNKFTIIVGIDVGKSHLVTCIRDAKTGTSHHEYLNNAEGLHRFIEDLKLLTSEMDNILVCCENTGRYMSKLARVCASYPLTLWAVHPTVMANYNPDLQRRKTDIADSVKIMEFAFAHNHKAVNYNLPEHRIAELEELFLLRKQLVGQRQQTLNQKSASTVWPFHHIIP